MLCRVPVKNPEENNSVVELYVQSVPDNLHTRSLLDLLEQVSCPLPAPWQWQAAAADLSSHSSGSVASPAPALPVGQLSTAATALAMRTSSSQVLPVKGPLLDSGRCCRGP